MHPVIILATPGPPTPGPTQPPVCRNVVDLCFIIDSSGSIRDNNPADGSYDNYDLQLEFLADLAGSFTVGPDATQIGAVLFSEQVTLEFKLNEYTDATMVQNALRNMEYLGEFTNTPRALQVTRQQCFSSSNGDRPDVQNIAIIVTDGLPFPVNRRTPAIEEAQRLRDNGVQMIAIGITDTIDREFLKEMSSPPQQEGVNYFSAPTFQALEELTVSVVEGTCVGPPPAPGICTVYVNSVMCKTRLTIIYRQCAR